MRSLVIVQATATQFDGPFYRFLEEQKQIQVSVYYTESGGALQPYDPEIGRHSNWDHDIKSGYSFRVYPTGLMARFKTSLSLVRSRPSLVILSGWRSLDNLSVLIGSKLAGVPVGIRSDNCLYNNGPRLARSPFRRFVLRQLLRLFATGHPVGSLAAEYLVSNGFDRRRMFLFPYLVDQQLLTHIYQRAALARSRLRAEYGIAPDAFVVLGVMKFVEREDPLTLLKAFGEIGGAHSHLVLVGDGALRMKIEEIIGKERIANVHLPGYVAYTKLPEFFAIADVLVHSARLESWGVTVNEALVCGLPVIAANSVGAVADLIEEGVNGYSFPAGDYETLGQLLRRVSESADLLDGLRVRCTRPAKLARFTYHATQQSLRSALDLVSNQGQGQPD